MSRPPQCRDEKAIGIAESSKVKSSLSTCLEDRDKVQSQMVSAIGSQPVFLML